MSVLVSSDLARPENFHEIARPRLIEVIEVLAKPQLVKETRRAGSVGIPAAPDSFAIALIPNDEPLQGGIIEMKVASRAQSLDCPDEHEIRCARAEAWPRWQNEKFSGLKMRRRLKADLREMRNRIAAALRHLFDLLENQVVVIAGERRRRGESEDRKKNPSRASFHGGISKRQTANWQSRRASFDPLARIFVIPSEVEESLILGRHNEMSRPRLDMTTSTAAATIMIMLRFTKMNGAGNDFILIDNRAGDIHLDRSQIAHLCDRHRGIGADGILLLEKATNRADFRMRYFNADGGEAEMCGNGARCFARFANKVAGAQAKICFETPAGVISAELVGDLVTLQMTEPTDLRLDIKLPVANGNKTVHFINSGVPHVVIPIPQIDDVDVRRDGSAIRYHKMFSPRGANVNFIEKRGPKKIAIRTYERGVEDETLACGTGIVASALIFAAIEKLNGPISVTARGGDELHVGFEESHGQFRNVTLTGPAEFVFEGTVEI